MPVSLLVLAERNLVHAVRLIVDLALTIRNCSLLDAWHMPRCMVITYLSEPCSVLNTIVNCVPFQLHFRGLEKNENGVIIYSVVVMT